MSQNDKVESPKSRQAILEAYNKLVLNSGGLEIRVSDIVREADIGRSTFYEHFPNAESVLQQAVSEPFRIFANASLQEDFPRLLDILRHFADNRIQATTMMSDARVRDQLVSVLTNQYDLLLAEKIVDTQQRKLCTTQLAEANLAMVRQWIGGQLPCEDSEVVRFILNCTKQVLALFE